MPVEQQGEVVARGGEAGGELDRPPQQILRIAMAPDAAGELGQHADRADVGRRLLQPRAQQGLGDGKVVAGERVRGLQQGRIGDRRVERGQMRRIATRLVAGEMKLVATRAPRFAEQHQCRRVARDGAQYLLHLRDREIGARDEHAPRMGEGGVEASGGLCGAAGHYPEKGAPRASCQ